MCLSAGGAGGAVSSRRSPDRATCRSPGAHVPRVASPFHLPQEGASACMKPCASCSSSPHDKRAAAGGARARPARSRRRYFASSSALWRLGRVKGVGRRQLRRRERPRVAFGTDEASHVLRTCLKTADTAVRIVVFDFFLKNNPNRDNQLRRDQSDQGHKGRPGPFTACAACTAVALPPSQAAALVGERTARLRPRGGLRPACTRSARSRQSCCAPCCSLAVRRSPPPPPRLPTRAPAPTTRRAIATHMHTPAHTSLKH